MDFNITQLRSIEHTWQTVISHIFHIKGADVQSICNYSTDVPFDTMLHDRRMRFLSQLCYVNNYSLQYLFNICKTRTDKRDAAVSEWTTGKVMAWYLSTLYSI